VNPHAVVLDHDLAVVPGTLHALNDPSWLRCPHRGLGVPLRDPNAVRIDEGAHVSPTNLQIGALSIGVTPTNPNPE